MEASSTDFQSDQILTWKKIILYTGLILSILIGLIMILNFEKLQEKTLWIFHRNDLPRTFHRIGVESFSDYSPLLNNKIDATTKKLNAFLPNEPYIVVNTTGNYFKLFNGKQELIREGLVSTGSYTVLKAGKNRQWIFKTPRGQLKVLAKTKDPVWKRPDWAFIEEGLKVPSYNHPSRYEYGTLGDYSLSLGDGYLIHGTLYKRFLGLPVTHGCIRMGDDDLELVFKTLKRGSKVYIY